MQSLLTRAGRAHSCGCNTCFGLPKTIIRRSTTGAEVKVSYRHAFTTLYTSIFATAAVVDAKYKDDRRKHLEDQISEAKNAVARLQLQNAVAEAEVQPSALASVAHNGTADEGPTILDRAEIQPSLIAPPDKQESPNARIFEQYGGRHWDIFHPSKTERTLRALTTSDYRILERMLYATAEQDEPLISGRKPAHSAAYITRLVQFLLAEHDRMVALRNHPHLRSPLRETIDRLMSTGYPNISLARDDPMARKNLSFRLSKRMARDIHDATTACGIIERICYNLLTSQQPLTSHTFNTMIVYLSKFGRNNIAQCIIRCHFEQFRKHHPESEAVILNHDREFGNYAAAYRNVNVILNKYSTYLLPTRTGEAVLDSAVRAFAGFRNIKDAAVVLCHGLSLGITIGAQALLQLIGLSIWELDRSVALKLVRAFTDYPREFELMLTAEPGSYSVLLHQMDYLLDVAGLWRDPSKMRAQLEKYNLDPERFRRFRMMIAVHNIQQQLDQVERTVRRIERIIYRGVRTRQSKGISKADMVKRIAKEGTRAAADFDFHMEAAMPAMWLTNHIKTSNPINASQWRRRVWTARDHKRARANLRLAVLSKEVEDGAKQLANCSLEVREMDGNGVLRQEQPNELLDVGNIAREPVAAIGLG